MKKYSFLCLICFYFSQSCCGQYFSYNEDFENIDTNGLPKGWSFSGDGICKIVQYHLHKGDTLWPTSGKNMLLLQKDGSNSQFGYLKIPIQMPPGKLSYVSMGSFIFKSKGYVSGNDKEFFVLKVYKKDSIGNTVLKSNELMPIIFANGFKGLVRGGYGPGNPYLLKPLFDTFQLGILVTQYNYNDSGDFNLLDELSFSFDTSAAARIGIDQVNSQPFVVSVYPNPTNDKLTIETAGVFTCQLMDIEGRMVLSTEKSRDVTNIELWQLPPAIYILKIQSNGSEVFKKIVKY